MSNGAAIKRNSSSRGGIDYIIRKKRKISTSVQNSRFQFFEELPEDLVVDIISKLGATASCPADFINLHLTCKKFNKLGRSPLVLSAVSPKAFTPMPTDWSVQACRFLKSCADAGNIEAIYTLGMIWFYCEERRDDGKSLLKKAAIKAHPDALYSLSIIHFNGSGLTKNDKDLRAGVALAARAAFLGHINALRELGHCLQDGYGVRQNIPEGRRFLMQANAREIASLLPPNSANITTTDNNHPDGTPLPASTFPVPVPNTAPPKAFSSFQWITSLPKPKSVSSRVPGTGSSLLSDFGCNVPQEPHPANRFLTQWFEMMGGVPVEGDEDLTLCSNEGCGRPETRTHEFRRCSICGAVNYCSRACQALDWKRRHQGNCTPMAVDNDADDGEESDVEDNAVDEIQEEEAAGDGDDDVDVDVDVDIEGEEEDEENGEEYI